MADPFSAIAGGLASGIAGGLMGGGGGGSKGRKTVPLIRHVRGGGLFDTSVHKRSGQIALSPEVQAYQQAMLGQAGQYAGMGADPRVAAMGGQALGAGQGFLGQAMQPALRGAGAVGGAFGTLGQAFDPFGAAETQFQRLESILEPGRERQREAQEARLFAQGRLGATGGALEQQALEESIEASRRANLAEALGQAQSLQQQELARAGVLGQLGLGAEQAGLQR